jgi:RNA polymerase sigma factor (TIGR02999 family)
MIATPIDALHLADRPMLSHERHGRSAVASDVPNEQRHGRQSLDRIMPVVYEHLRAIASRHLALREGGGTLSPTGLVHEAYLKLVDQSTVTWKDRGHFFALASLAMRHVLVDRAKARFAQKREGALQRVSLDNEQIPGDDQAEAMLDINDAVDRLAVVEPRLAQVIECRFFGGLSEDETAEALGITTRTVQRDWAKARMLLRRALTD